MEKLILERKGNAVYHNGKQLTIVAQATKGPGNEVVKVDGLPGSNGQKWVSLKHLQEGSNELTCKAKETTYKATGSSTPSKKYELTQDEAVQIGMLQGQINEIIEAAKARYVEKPSFTPEDVKAMTPEQKLEAAKKLEQWAAYLGLN